MMVNIKSSWTGSEDTYNYVRSQIKEKWGEDEAKLFQPAENCLTFKGWKRHGYMVKKGEKALKSYTFIEERDDKGEVRRKYQKTVCLFYYRQVEPMKKLTSPADIEKAKVLLPHIQIRQAA
ncbi:MAG: hypothetical protein HQL10_13825 [Nitrospirae bacterium]|nr:hypothetical protein [Nitrospirota bacterium]